MDFRIVEDLFQGLNRLDLRVVFYKGGDLFRIGIIDVPERSTRFNQSVALAVDVAVIEGRCGKGKLARLYHRRRFALRRIVHSIGV